jgi:MFS family permease
MLMGLSTLLIAFLPTYAMAGPIAPALLCLLRFRQGFGLGGEWGGASLLAVENAPKVGSAVRLRAAAGCAAGLPCRQWPVPDPGGEPSDADFAAWGWRIPFLASALLVGLVCGCG